MYIPNYSHNENIDLIKKIIQDYPFATLITTLPELEINHYPFIFESLNDELVLYCHFAKSNPQWKMFETDPQATIIFQGPHRYMSPSWYENRITNVPTWNYAVIHFKVKGFIINDAAKSDFLMTKMVSNYEKQFGTNWTYDIPQDFKEKLFQSIVWLKFNVVQIQSKFKLSQNRNNLDYESIIKNLNKSTVEQDKKMLEYMLLSTYQS